ncbi:MAG: BMP family ABC transporter substrate-binding protein [Oscillospiraceae bacterium]|nr:BMP family ABC transporter substrate-binding protein [Oscillospiraceae bacterium]
MKKILAILLCAMMLLSIAACNNGQNSTSPGTTENTDNENELSIETIKVGFVHISDPSDMGYTYNHDLGTKSMQAALGLTDDQIINKYNIDEGAATETALRELVEAGCNIIFATSFGFENYVLIVAEEYPDVEFCHASGYQAADSGLSNVHNYFVAIYEARYLAGIAAGLKTESNQLGYVAAFPFAEVISGYTAFYLGAKSVNPDVTMEVMYTNSWNDPSKEAQVTQALIQRGADVISQHSDSTAPATTSEANGVWQVGYNADMISAAPNASLVSARADWGIYVTYVVEQILKGEAIPIDWCKGYEDGAVYLSPLNEEIVAPGTKEAIEEAAAAILAGFHVFSGPLTGEGLDWDGNTIFLDLADGEYFPESQDQSAPSFNYIVEGITIIE